MVRIRPGLPGLDASPSPPPKSQFPALLVIFRCCSTQPFTINALGQFSNGDNRFGVRRGGGGETLISKARGRRWLFQYQHRAELAQEDYKQNGEYGTRGLSAILGVFSPWTGGVDLSPEAHQVVEGGLLPQVSTNEIGVPQLDGLARSELPPRFLTVRCGGQVKHLQCAFFQPKDVPAPQYASLSAARALSLEGDNISMCKATYLRQRTRCHTENNPNEDKYGGGGRRGGAAGATSKSSTLCKIVPRPHN
jgi:hypothetical protein